MKNLMFFLMTILGPIALHAGEAPFVTCHQEKISRAIQISRNEVRQIQYKVKTRTGLMSKDLRPDLIAIEAIEKNVFKKKLFNLGYDVIPGASISVNPDLNAIAIYRDSIAALNALGKNSQSAHNFVMAHEIGHMVQAHWQMRFPGQPSPMGLAYGFASDTDEFNLLHAETDCIGIELMRMAGQKDFSMVIPSLKQVTTECKTLRDPGFCERAEQIRVQSVQLYMDSLSLGLPNGNQD
jgi:hypothetical protein